MKYAKKVVAAVLACSLALSMSTVAFSGMSESVRFIAAVERTNQKLRADENKVWDAYAKSLKLTENFLAAPYDLNMSANVDLETDYTVLKNIGFTMLSQYNFVTNEMAYNLGGSLSDGTDSVAANANMYMSEEQMTVNVPQLFEEYLTIPFEGESDGTSAVVPLGMSEMMKEAFDSADKALALYSKEDLQAAEDRYNDLFTNLLFDLKTSDFTSAEDQVITIGGRDVTCSGIALRLSAENLNSLVGDFSDTFEADPWIKDLYSSMFTTTTLNALGYDDIDNFMAAAADSIRYINFTDGMTITAYVNDYGYIVRYVADFVAEGMPVQVTYDQKGENLLTDDLVISAKVTQDDSTADFVLTYTGNSLPENGPLTADLNMSYSINDEAQVDILDFNYSYDTAKSSDNFSYALDFNGDFNPIVLSTASANDPNYSDEYEQYLESMAEIAKMEGYTEEPMSYSDYVEMRESYASYEAPVIAFTMSGTGTAVDTETTSKLVLTDNKFETEGVSATFDFTMDLLPSTKAITAVPVGAEALSLEDPKFQSEAFNTSLSEKLEKLSADLMAALQ